MNLYRFVTVNFYPSIIDHFTGELVVMGKVERIPHDKWYRKKINKFETSLFGCTVDIEEKKVSFKQWLRAEP